MFSVEPTKTTATFLFGHEMTMTSQGRTQSVTAPGFQVSTLLGQAKFRTKSASSGIRKKCRDTIMSL